MCTFHFPCALPLSRSRLVGFWVLFLLPLLFLRIFLVTGLSLASLLLPLSFSVLFFGQLRRPSSLVCPALPSLLLSQPVLLLPRVLGSLRFPLLLSICLIASSALHFGFVWDFLRPILFLAYVVAGHFLSCPLLRPLARVRHVRLVRLLATLIH